MRWNCFFQNQCLTFDTSWRRPSDSWWVWGREVMEQPLLLEQLRRTQLPPMLHTAPQLGCKQQVSQHVAPPLPLAIGYQPKLTVLLQWIPSTPPLTLHRSADTSGNRDVEENEDFWRWRPQEEEQRCRRSLYFRLVKQRNTPTNVHQGLGSNSRTVYSDRCMKCVSWQRKWKGFSSQKFKNNTMQIPHLLWNADWASLGFLPFTAVLAGVGKVTESKPSPVNSSLWYWTSWVQNVTKCFWEKADVRREEWGVSQAQQQRKEVSVTPWQTRRWLKPRSQWAAQQEQTDRVRPTSAAQWPGYKILSLSQAAVSVHWPGGNICFTGS